MRNLLLSSLTAIILTGCTIGHYGRLTVFDSKTPLPKPIFSDNFNSFLFKTNIHVYGKDFSGLLVTKQVQPNDYRVIFTTELGMKLFDFEFKDTSFTLHYCVPQFNRPVLLKTIQHDIELLLMTNLYEKSVTHLTDKKGMFDIQRIQFDDRYNYYYIEKASQHLVKIEHSTKWIKKTIFTLNDYKNNFPDNIIIDHRDIKLKIELNLLKR
jgi:hypothetical protein